MSGNQFINNTAALSGVLESHSSTITIEESEFHHNSGRTLSVRNAHSASAYVMFTFQCDRQT